MCLEEMAGLRIPVGALFYGQPRRREVVQLDDALRQLVTDVRDRLGAASGVVALGAEIDGKAAVIVATNPDARTAGLSAGVLAKRAAAVLGGGGGGRDDVAQGGGADPKLIPAALDDIRSALGA